MLTELKNRGLVHQMTNETLFVEKESKGLTLYAGFDPTADSLHVGSLLPILTLKRFQDAGHKVIVLVGGATGLIGDPSGKKAERTLNSEETVGLFATRVQAQLSHFLRFDGENAAEIVNNFEWTDPLSTISLLRDIGKHFTLSTMLAKESVKSRLESGISFTEFAYMILQANDFYELFKTKGCYLQLGGSDQWGNITAGLELIRKKEGVEALGLTIPLVTKSDGTKFGKTESGTIWLDGDKTSAFDFYQFWLQTPDNDVSRFLRLFSFLSLPEIEKLEQATLNTPHLRLAQKKLAEELTLLVHGKEDLQSAISASEALFNGRYSELPFEALLQIADSAPQFTLHCESLLLVDALAQSKLCSSKREARELINAGAIKVNGEKVTDVSRTLSQALWLHDRYIIVDKGRKKKMIFVKNAEI
jgi:tyrosyl-tRNA synthetase